MDSNANGNQAPTVQDPTPAPADQAPADQAPAGQAAPSEVVAGEGATSGAVVAGEDLAGHEAASSSHDARTPHTTNPEACERKESTPGGAGCGKCAAVCSPDAQTAGVSVGVSVTGGVVAGTPEAPAAACAAACAGACAAGSGKSPKSAVSHVPNPDAASPNTAQHVGEAADRAPPRTPPMLTATESDAVNKYPRMRLGDYLCLRIFEAGCKDVFGVPGDFNLSFLDRVVESKLNYIGACNELNAAYASDGYARIAGLGCCITTYAVGELSAINGVAGAYAECVPVVKIAGAPKRQHFKDMPLLHHTLGDYMTPYRMYEPVTVDQCFLNDPRVAARNIDRVLRHCLLFKRPVYVALPSDMVDVEIPCTEGVWRNPIEPESDRRSLEEALEEIVTRLKASKRPVLIPGVELIRRGLQPLFEELTTKSHIPYATMLLSKGLITESHPNFMGLYMGARSQPEVRQAVADSDCVIILGEKLTDFNTGGFTSDFNYRTRIIVNYDNVVVSSHSYRNVYLTEMLTRLVTAIPVFADPAYVYPRARYGCPNRRDSVIAKCDEEKLSMRYVFKKLAKVLPERCILMAETGASMFAAAETMLPDGGLYMGQTFYGSIGYTVGACLGASIACKSFCPERRVILSVGDGSFQLTAQELSTMIRYKCNPVILLINNDGYTIERVITDNVYNNIQRWDYAALPKVFGAEREGFRARTQGDLAKALSFASTNPNELVFIEAFLDRWDCNMLLKAAGRSMALNNNLKPSITEEMLIEQS